MLTHQTQDSEYSTLHHTKEEKTKPFPLMKISMPFSLPTGYLSN